MIVARIVMIVTGMVRIVARIFRKVRILAIMVEKIAGWSRLKG